MKRKEKQNTMKEKFVIKKTRERKELLDDMCNLSDGIFNKGVEQGIAQGARQANMKTAHTMLLNNMSLDLVRKSIPDLTDEDMKEVLQEMKQTDAALT